MRVLPALVVLSVLPGCALTKLWFATGKSHPDPDGTVDAPGLVAEATLTRDVHGVPHIRAASEADAWYGLGVAHAQDRLWQADLARRLAYGRLSEFLGMRTAEVDGFMQGLELEQRMAQVLERSDPEARAMIESYTAGFNAGAASLPALPIEYRLLKVDFDPWKPTDTGAITFLQSWALSENVQYEMFALLLADELDAETLDDLTRLHPATPPIDGYWDQLRKVELGAFTPGFEAFDDVLGGSPEVSEASNNWVVAGTHTHSGMPIVANDPHLLQGVPSLWYVADVAGGDLHVTGVTLPGTPGVVIGHNEHIAWGLTNVMADMVDLAVVERTAHDHYVLAGETKPLRTVDARVAVKDRAARLYKSVHTELGPVITDLDADHLLVLQWHALQLEDQVLDAFHGLNLATSVDEALTATDRPMMVAQNLVVADTEGHIAWRPVGSLVKRRAHTGRVPYDASDPEHGWDGWLEDRPGLVDPESGYVHSANSRPEHPTADAISTSFVPPHRHDRIDELLSEGGPFSPEDLQRMQLDLVDGMAARHLTGLLEGVTPEGWAETTCHRLLRDWDREMTADSAAALVWPRFHRAYLREAVADDVGDRVTDALLQISSHSRSPLSGNLDRFVQDRRTSVRKALGVTCTELRDTYGDDTGTWSWGAAHPLKLEHRFAGGRKLLRSWNMEPVPYPGSGATVAAAGFDWNDPDLWSVGGMASVRLVMPLDDLRSSTLVHPGGQSGQPKHEGYNTHYDAFVGEETLPLWSSEDDLSGRTIGTLRLVPSGG